MSDAGIDPRWDGAFIPIEHWHLHAQLLGRYGIVLGPGEFSKILADIKHGKAILVLKHPGSTIYSVRIQSVGERIYVATAGDRFVLTALPPSKRLNEIRRRLFDSPQG